MWLRILAGALLNCTRTPHMKELYAAIDDHIQQYEEGTATISDDIEFSMRQTVIRGNCYTTLPRGRFRVGANEAAA